MKSIAKSYAYWPGMDNDIERLVQQCDKCQQAAKFPTRQEPVPWPLTEKSWTRLHVDFAGPIDDWTYLIIVDAHSKWPEVIPLRQATTTATMAALDKVFPTH